ncbi:unnamed protein product [Calypogeia fissa]
MEARSRRVGGGFPGYNGPALPRAMRSSRGRGQSTTRTSGYGGRSGFFELLATVAGQILQEDSAGEEQDMLKLSERSTLKQKCSDMMESRVKEPELPVRVARAEKLQREPSSTIVSCLQSLGEAITDHEEKNLLCEQTKNDDIGADSVHSVVSKAFLSRAPSGECSQAPPETELKSNLETGCKIAINPAPKVCDMEKQMMTSSVSDNDENHTVKSDPDSSISNAVKHPSGFDKMHVDSEETIDSLPNPKAEELGNSKEHDDEKEVVSGIRGNEQAAEMEIDLPKASVKYSLNFDCTAQDPVSSTVTDVTKAEPSSEEVTHPHSKLLNEDETVMDTNGKMKITDQSRSNEGVKPWKSREFYGKEDEGDSGLEVDDKSQVDTKKLLKVTDVILGKLESNDVEAECGFLSELILGNLRQRISSKDRNCGSSKQMFQGKVSKKSKESYAKGMRARKVVKMVKRSRVSSSRSKRKHAEMEAGADSDEGLAKKAYYGGLSYTRQRTSRGFPAKRNKTADGSSTPGPDLHVNTTNLMDLGFECAEGEPPAAAAKLRSAKAASVASSPTARGCTAKLSKKGGESHVKLTIKSFTVPELSVDLPESATISNLKRAVMDAAMNLLGGGLRVRVLLQGKKIPDEGATLAQVGISRAGKPDSLGFMLEPSPVPTSPTSTSEDPLLVLSRAAGQPSPRYPVFGATAAPSGGDLGGRCPKRRPGKPNGGTADPEACGTSLAGDFVEGKLVGLGFALPPDDGTKGCPANKPKPGLSDRTTISHSTRVAAAGALAAIRAQADASRRVSKNESELAAPVAHPIAHDSLVPGSGAIILHPGTNVGENMQGLALVPVRQKPHSLDVGKRRVRRPFTVAEVEALVHAVEKLGTGRWRDVKLRAFDQAKHRTYVDLKDKWKTLVHTARIAPHQRRGEPVPQELLERVTRAHAYWTAQAAKQQAELDY